MGKLLTITGNYKKDGKWGSPDPYFRGPLIVEGDMLYGYCVLMSKVDKPERERLRCLYGRYIEKKNGSRGLMLLMLSLENAQDSIMFTLKDSDNSSGKWAAIENYNPGISYDMIEKDEAELLIDESDYTSQDYRIVRFTAQYYMSRDKSELNYQLTDIIRHIYEYAASTGQ